MKKFIIIFILSLSFVVPNYVYAQTTSESASISKTKIEYEVARDYFSTILNAQTTIFALIVAALLGLNWLYQRKVTRDEIKKEVDKQIQSVKKDLSKDVEKKQKDLLEAITTRLNQGDVAVGILRGEVYRSMAQFWDSQNSNIVAFIWWVRAAHAFYTATDESMTRIALSSARNSVDLIQYGYLVDASTSGEAQRLLTEIDSEIYKIEKEMLYESIKKTLKKGTATQS